MMFVMLPPFFGGLRKVNLRYILSTYQGMNKFEECPQRTRTLSSGLKKDFLNATISFHLYARLPCDSTGFFSTIIFQLFLGAPHAESRRTRVHSQANTRQKASKISDVSFFFQSQTNVITTMVDVASFVCCRLFEESVPAQMDSIFEMMDKPVTVILK